MASTAIHSSRRITSSLPATISDQLLHFFSRAAARRELRSLSPAQLRDAGIDPTEVRKGPVVDVEAALMSRLMSLL